MASKVIGDLIVRLEAQTEQFNRELEKARETNKRFKKQTDETKAGLGELGKEFRRLLPAISIGALVSFTRRTIELGDQLAKQSRLIGFTADQYLSLQESARDAGVEQDALARVMRRYAAAAGDAATGGTGPLAVAFDRLKIDVRSATGAIRPMPELLAETARKLVDVADPLERMNLAAAIFGGRSTAIVSALPEIAKGFGHVGTEVDQAVKQLERADDQIDKVVNTLNRWRILAVGGAISILDPDDETRVKNAYGEILLLNRLIREEQARGGEEADKRRAILEDAVQFQNRIIAAIRGRQKAEEEASIPAVQTAETLISKTAEQLALEKEIDRLRKSAARPAIDYSFLRGPLDGGRASGARRSSSAQSPLDFSIPLGPVEGRWDAFEARISTSQELIRDSTRSTMNAFTSEIDRGLSAGEFSFKNFARQVLGSLSSILTTALVTKFITTPLLGAFGITAAAKGLATDHGRVIPYARGGLTSGPELFPLSGGRVGLRGEAETEAVLPLKRTRSGNLGVEATGGGGANVFAPSVTINYQGGGGRGEDRNAPRELGAELKRQLAEFWRSQYLAERRTGGVLRPIG